MLDNPQDYDIYQTSRCYDKLEAMVQRRLRAAEQECGEWKARWKEQWDRAEAAEQERATALIRIRALKDAVVAAEKAVLWQIELKEAAERKCSPEYIRERLTATQVADLCGLARSTTEIVDGIVAALCAQPNRPSNGGRND